MHRLLRIARPQRLQRSLSTSVRRLDAHAKPMLLGEGSGVGQVATEETQGTGLARLQLLGTMKGVDVFNEQPLDASRLGTLDDPIIVPSLAQERIIGCSGFPAESHDTLWLVLRHENVRRCPECGSVYKLGYEADEHDAHGHGHH